MPAVLVGCGQCLHLPAEQAAQAAEPQSRLVGLGRALFSIDQLLRELQGTAHRAQPLCLQPADWAAAKGTDGSFSAARGSVPPSFFPVS